MLLLIEPAQNRRALLPVHPERLAHAHISSRGRREETALSLILWKDDCLVSSLEHSGVTHGFHTTDRCCFLG